MRRALVTSAIAFVACDAPVIRVAEKSDSSEVVSPPFVEYARAVCTGLRNCAPFELDARWGGFDRCVERLSVFVWRLSRGPAVNITDEQVTACARAREVVDCAKWAHEELLREMPAACNVPGKRPLGAGCASEFDCQSYECDGQCGRCVEGITEASPCNARSRCARGLQCVLGTCVRPRDLDQACNIAQPCFPHLACAAGKCVRAPIEGAPCLTDGDRPCSAVTALRCDGGKCTRPPLAAPSASCGSAVDGGPTLCQYGTLCRASAPGAVGTCVPAPSYGSSCGGYYDLSGPCQSPAVCLRGICRDLEPADCDPPPTPP
jgi:hypothetical protein